MLQDAGGGGGGAAGAVRAGQSARRAPALAGPVAGPHAPVRIYIALFLIDCNVDCVHMLHAVYPRSAAVQRRLRALDAAVTPWPLFVYEIFDYESMRHAIHDYFRTIMLGEYIYTCVP